MTAMMEHGMVGEKQAEAVGSDATKGEKKKVGWTGTILWMLGMILLFNLVAGIVVYFVMSPK